jgi:phosphoglycerol transferase MdoB-like AlkP superfamily enzyme
MPNRDPTSPPERGASLALIPRHLLFIVAVYGIGLFFFTFFRLLLLWRQWHQMAELPDPTALLWRSLWMGWRFDTVISGYILSIPLLLLFAASLLKTGRDFLISAVAVWIAVLYSAAFFACCADVPFYHQFHSRLTIAALNWAGNTGFVVGMIFREPSFFIYLLLFLVTGVLFSSLVWKLRKWFFHRRAVIRSSLRFIAANVLLTGLAAGLVFLGIRGRIARKSPIRVGTAYFSNYAFPNHLGLNPVFTFMSSYLEQKKFGGRSAQWMPAEDALKQIQSYFDITTDATWNSPIARRVRADGDPRRLNVILVLMESMSAAKMGRYGNPDHLTPVLDSLAQISYCFDNLYSDGIHTYNGIYATLFSYPVLLDRHPMKGTPIPDMDGFAAALAEQGYTTIFFTTHDDQFDNMAGFLRANGFHHLFGQKDYPSERILSTLGVADDYLFEFAVEKINAIRRDDVPFFAALLTASDHDPIVIPSDIPFQPRHSEAKRKVVEYADWSIGKFLQLASRQSWYDSTLFVFVADHGAALGNSSYEIPLDYVHIPLIIFAPKILQPAVFDRIGGQVDIYPTVMGLLNMSYINNTLGVDLLKERRRFIEFSADRKVGCVDAEYFWIYDEGREALYHYRPRASVNELEQHPLLADSMKTFAFAVLQTAQWLRENQLTGSVHSKASSEAHK